MSSVGMKVTDHIQEIMLRNELLEKIHMSRWEESRACLTNKRLKFLLSVPRCLAPVPSRETASPVDLEGTMELEVEVSHPPRSGKSWAQQVLSLKTQKLLRVLELKISTVGRC